MSFYRFEMYRYECLISLACDTFHLNSNQCIDIAIAEQMFSRRFVVWFPSLTTCPYYGLHKSIIHEKCRHTLWAMLLHVNRDKMRLVCFAMHSDKPHSIGNGNLLVTIIIPLRLSSLRWKLDLRLWCHSMVCVFSIMFIALECMSRPNRNRNRNWYFWYFFIWPVQCPM